MRTAQQRSNYCSFSFHPAASPKRLHSLADICAILDKSAPADPRHGWEVTEWLLVPVGRTKSGARAHSDASRAESLAARHCGEVSDAERRSQRESSYRAQTLCPKPQPASRGAKPCLQQTTLAYTLSSTSYSQPNELENGRSLDMRACCEAPRKPPELNSIFDEAVASAELLDGKPKTASQFFRAVNNAEVQRQSVFRICSAKTKVKPQVVAKKPPMKQIPPNSYVFAQKPRNSLEAREMILAAEAEKSRPPVIDLDAPSPEESPKQNGSPQIGMLAQSNGKPPESPPARPPGIPSFSCPVPGCDKAYRRKCRVIEHMRSRHKYEGIPRFRCLSAGCHKSYSRLDALKAHFRAESHKGYDLLFEPNNGQPHKEDSPEPVKVQKVEPDSDGSLRYKCKYSECTKSYSTKYRLNMHETACHGSNMEKPFVCGFPGCPKAYATKDSLTRHRRNYCHPAEGETKPSEPEKPKPVEVEKPKEKELPSDFQDRVQELVELFDEI